MDYKCLKYHFRKFPWKYMACMGCIVAIAIFAIAASILYLSQPKVDRYKFAVVDYKNEKVIFYLSEVLEFTEAPLYAIGAFNVIDTSLEYGTYRDSWRFVLESNRYDDPLCSRLKKREVFSRITYGEAPDCYKSMAPVKKIKKNVWYQLSECVTPVSKMNNNQKRVKFMLKDCPDNPKNTCLETNSPAPADIEERHKIMLKNLMKK